MKFLVMKAVKLRERAKAPHAIPSARKAFGLGRGKDDGRKTDDPILHASGKAEGGPHDMHVIPPASFVR
jgi:hypothetical protein